MPVHVRQQVDVELTPEVSQHSLSVPLRQLHLRHQILSQLKTAPEEVQSYSGDGLEPGRYTEPFADCRYIRDASWSENQNGKVRRYTVVSAVADALGAADFPVALRFHAQSDATVSDKRDDEFVPRGESDVSEPFAAIDGRAHRRGAQRVQREQQSGERQRVLREDHDDAAGDQRQNSAHCRGRDEGASGPEQIRSAISAG